MHFNGIISHYLCSERMCISGKEKKKKQRHHRKNKTKINKTDLLSSSNHKGSDKLIDSVLI
jgi:hypothetical protein